MLVYLCPLLCRLRGCRWVWRAFCAGLTSRCCWDVLHADNQVAIARAGAVEALVVLLRGDGGEEMKRSATDALANLADNAGECRGL
jgi:hypothetical protein